MLFGGIGERKIRKQVSAGEIPLKRLNWFNYGHPKTKNNAPPNFKPGNKK